MCIYDEGHQLPLYQRVLKHVLQRQVHGLQICIGLDLGQIRDWVLGYEFIKTFNLARANKWLMLKNPLNFL